MIYDQFIELLHKNSGAYCEIWPIKVKFWVYQTEKFKKNGRELKRWPLWTLIVLRAFLFMCVFLYVWYQIRVPAKKHVRPQ